MYTSFKSDIFIILLFYLKICLNFWFFYSFKFFIPSFSPSFFHLHVSASQRSPPLTWLTSDRLLRIFFRLSPLLWKVQVEQSSVFFAAKLHCRCWKLLHYFPAFKSFENVNLTLKKHVYNHSFSQHELMVVKTLTIWKGCMLF